MERMNWVARTRQRWKLRAGFALLAASGVFIVLGYSAFGKCEGPVYAHCATEDSGAAYMAAGGLVGLVSMLWLWLAVRCARCGKRIVWWAMSSKPSGAWLSAITNLQTCPGCGDAAGGPKPASSGPGA